MAYLNLDALRLPDKNNEANWWADHIEFFCLVSQDCIVTREQIVDRLLDENSNLALKATESLTDEDELDELSGVADIEVSVDEGDDTEI